MVEDSAGQKTVFGQSADKRTDIGFYSETDNNFWIGETTPSGFRYRIYSNLSAGGPDSARIMATPFPEEEVEIKNFDGLIPVSNKTFRVQSEYNANQSMRYGEHVFTGCFSGSCITPEQIIYDRALKKFRFLQYNQPIVDANISFDVTKSPDCFITARQPFRNKLTGKDEIIVYEQGGIAHNFFGIYFNGAEIVKTSIASFSEQSRFPLHFDIQKSLFRVNDFNNDGAPDILILDDQGSGNFILFVNNNVTTFVPIQDTPILLQNIFASEPASSDRNQRGMFKFFTWNFDGDAVNGIEVVFCDDTGRGS